MAVAMVSGNDGRFKASTTTTTVTIATIKSWKLTKTTTPIPVPNFESPTQVGSTNTLVYPAVLAGLSQATLTVEGQFNCDATDKTDGLITNGNYYYMDLIFVKGTPFGYDNVYALCTSFSPGTNIENQAASFTAEFTCSGVVPLSGVVT